MGFFSNLFSNPSAEDRVIFPWKPLRLIDQLQVILGDSNRRTQVIFKHSTSCGISRMVLRQFEKEHIDLVDQVDYYFLDIFENRPISNELSSLFQIVHESPQLICIKKGSVSYHASHGAINDIPLDTFV